MYTKIIKTPIGDMTATGDEQFLYSLEFDSTSAYEAGNTAPLKSIEKELNLYFSGKLKSFQTPLCLIGTDFQKKVWDSLIKIPYNKTISYSELACSIHKPTAFRAAAQANGRNPACIIVPCHRVINAGGGLGGYSSGLERKIWLLEHERKFG